MSFFKIALTIFTVSSAFLFGATFTVASYNTGGLPDHYDYLRAGCMEKLMGKRGELEPEKMARNENIQKLALKILFSPEPQRSQQEWEEKGYDLLANELFADKRNLDWQKQAQAMISSYKERPVVIYDPTIKENIQKHLHTWDSLAKTIFAEHLNMDILCLQEADYLKKEMFPEHYSVIFAQNSDAKNAIAWNKNRFAYVQEEHLDRALFVHLVDQESGKTIVVASAHLTGCNPYKGGDSRQGDSELEQILAYFKAHKADIQLIGMDSNVTSLHPRLHLVKDEAFQIDPDNYIEQTCTNPYSILNTRLDWIVLKSDLPDASITNIQVMGVDLNSIQTNISDHKPIAAKIYYTYH